VTQPRPLRVLHGPVNVGNQPWTLSREERRIGCQSDVVVNYPTWARYRADRVLGRHGDRSASTIVRRGWFALSAPWRYDVLHFYFGRSFTCWDDYGSRNPLWFADLKLARRIGRKVFMTLQGCDVRLSDRTAEIDPWAPCHLGRCSSAAACRASLDRSRRHLIESVLPLADRVFVLNPDLARHVPGALFMPYASVDVGTASVREPARTEAVTLLHAPSDPTIKGTSLIVEAVERLKRRFPIRFVTVAGLPHEEAMKQYEQADLVIDQVLCGWYGGLAVEAMAMGKPVACYVRDDDLRFVPAAMAAEIPLVRVTPATLEGDLAAALERRQEWPEWGRRSRDYVLRWHDPARIAASMVRAYLHPDSEFDLDAER